MIDNPFFVVGCARSGTTLLRDLLRQHPHLACPEETHFFRWSDPFATKAYESNYRRKKLFQQHRELDGVADWDFFYTLGESADRRMLMDHYARLFLEANGFEGRRWFDKSPQNVYGILLLGGLYPAASFVHIHRHPYNVVSSLKTGKIFDRQDIRAAANFWLESLTIVSQYRAAFPERVHEVRYEALTNDPQGVIDGVLAFLDERPCRLDLNRLPVHAEKDPRAAELSMDEMSRVDALCQTLMAHYGYA